MHDVTPSQQRLARDLRILAADAEMLLQHAVQDTGQGFLEARRQLQESLERAQARLCSLEDAVAGRTRKIGSATNTYVREHPWQTLGAIAGAALLAGYLLRRD